jgi:diguanylate cyclase (GGDEF)-like protein
MPVDDVAQRLQRALQGSSARLLQHAATFRYLLDQIPTGLVIAEATSGQIVVFNDEAARVLGHPLPASHDTNGYAEFGAVHPDGRRYEAHEHPLAAALKGEICQGECVLYRRGDGVVVELDVNAAPLWSEDDEIIGAVATFTDVSAQRDDEERMRWTLERLVEARTRDLTLRSLEVDRVNAELRKLSDGLEELVRQRTEELARQAQHDHLTGLPNRILLEERLERAVAAAERYGRSLAVLFLDLDGFKLVNDTFGHNGGDEVLRQVAERLGSGLRSSDTLARLSGDEFVVLVTEMRRPDDAREVAQAILSRLEAPCRIMGRDVTLSASIGISVYPQDATDAATLQQHADTAMYHAKDMGKDRISFYRRAEEPVLFTWAAAS